jgi:hypothetical protein
MKITDLLKEGVENEQGVAEGLEQDYLSQIPDLAWKPVNRSVWNVIQYEGLDEEQDAPNHSDWVMASLTISPKDSQALQAFDSDAIEDFNRFDIHLKSRYPGLTDLIDYDNGTVTIVKPVTEQGVMEGTNDIVNSLTNLRATVKQILTGRAEYPQGFASQLEVALYDAINALRDSPEQGALDTVNELSELRAIAKQVQTGKGKFPQGYTGRLERVLYDAIKQIENVSQDMTEGNDFDDEVEVVADPDSDKIPNLVMQFRKAIDVDGNHSIIFKDGKKAKLPVATMVNFLEKYAQLKPADRELMQDVAIQSLDKLKEIVMTFKGSKAPSSIYTK